MKEIQDNILLKLNNARENKNIKDIIFYQKELNRILNKKQTSKKLIRERLTEDESYNEGSGVIYESEHRIKSGKDHIKSNNGMKVQMHLKSNNMSSRRKIHLIDISNLNELKLLRDNLKIDNNFKLYFECLHNYKHKGKECNKICNLDSFLKRCYCKLGNESGYDNIRKELNLIEQKGQELSLELSKNRYINMEIDLPKYCRCPNINCEGHNNPFKILDEYRMDNNPLLIYCPMITNGKCCQMSINDKTTDTWFCSICGKQHNPKTTACEIKNRIDKEYESNCLEGLKSGSLQRCPNCNIIVAKDENCDKIDCSCGNRFCFKCGKSINKEINYIDDHLMIGPTGNFECRETMLLKSFKNEDNLRLFINESIKNNRFLKRTIEDLLCNNISNNYRKYLKKLLYKF